MTRPREVASMEIRAKLHFDAETSSLLCRVILSGIAEGDRVWIDFAAGGQSTCTALTGSRLDNEGAAENGVVLLPRGRDFSALFEYRSLPGRGFYVSKSQGKVAWVYTIGQTDDTAHWLPCILDNRVRAVLHLELEVPLSWIAISNGARAAVIQEGNTARHCFAPSRPLPAYLLTFAAGIFDEHSIDSRCCVHVPRGLPSQKFAGIVATTRVAIPWLEKLLGVAFPFEIYQQAVIPDLVFVGMENAAATLFSDAILDDAASGLASPNTRFVAHEIVHQWIGNWVTAASWRDAWIQEGLAVFFDHLFALDHESRDAYELAWEEDVVALAQEIAERGPRSLTQHGFRDGTELFDAHLYERAGLVFHRLYVELGRERFLELCRTFLMSHAWSCVTTEDLLSTFSGEPSCAWLVGSIHRVSHPDLRVELSWQNGKFVTCVSTPAVDDFEVELEVGWREMASQKLILRECGMRHFECIREPDFVRIDPMLRWPGPITITLPDRWIASALAGQDTRGKRVALRSLCNSEVDSRFVAFVKQGLEDANWTVRKVAAEICGAAGLSIGLERLAVEDDVRVRWATVTAYKRSATTSDEAAAAHIRKALSSTEVSSRVRSGLLYALGRTGTRDSVHELEACLLRPDSTMHALETSGALAGLVALRCAPPAGWLAYAKHPSAAVRTAVVPVLALENASLVERLELLNTLATDVSPYVRIEVARTCGKVVELQAHVEPWRKGERNARVLYALETYVPPRYR